MHKFKEESTILKDKLIEQFDEPKYAHPNIAIWYFEYYEIKKTLTKKLLKKEKNEKEDLIPAPVSYVIYDIKIILDGEENICTLECYNNLYNSNRLTLSPLPLLNRKTFNSKSLISKDIIQVIKDIIKKENEKYLKKSLNANQYSGISTNYDFIRHPNTTITTDSTNIGPYLSIYNDPMPFHIEYGEEEAIQERLDTANHRLEKATMPGADNE